MKYSEIEGRYVSVSQAEMSQWIDNDEGLYNWWRSSRQSKTKFIKENHAEIEKAILAYLNQKPSR